MMDKLRVLRKEVAEKLQHYEVLVLSRAKHQNPGDIQFLAGNREALLAVLLRINEMLKEDETDA